MKFLIKLVVALVLALGLGIGSAYIMMEKKAAAGAIRNGPWGMNANIGSEDTDPYVRSYVALHGLFALNKKEAIYFTALTDSDGAALSGGCTYKVSGSTIPARWWTITAYGSDDFLIPGGEGHFSVSINDLGDGKFSFPIAPQLEADTFGLATADAKSFLLLLRTYNPEPSLVADPTSAALPVIQKEGCNE